MLESIKLSVVFRCPDDFCYQFQSLTLTLTSYHLHGRGGTSVDSEVARRTVNTTTPRMSYLGNVVFSAEVEISETVKRSGWKFTVWLLPWGLLSSELMLFVRGRQERMQNIVLVLKHPSFTYWYFDA